MNPTPAPYEVTTTTAIEQAVSRSQVYGFLTSVYLYPTENWSEDLPLAAAVAARLPHAPAWPAVSPLPLPSLQAAYRRCFGVAGSLPYETEYDLPHEYRQAQELADIAGFYRAFGFTVGGPVRERPDHLAAELEFMHLLTLKEAHALATGLTDAAAICREAQARFLADHLGAWVDLFAASLALNTTAEPYPPLARYTTAWVHAEAALLGVSLSPRRREQARHTPFDPDFTCATCPVVELVGYGREAA
ncbi:MAG: molecular chaperone TorD family protein [Caldilineales bacterium]|nr:molecular chaperone TorD family protein [Caldilineales bacterium]